MFGYGNSVSDLKNMAGAVHVNQHTRRLGRLVLFSLLKKRRIGGLPGYIIGALRQKYQE